VSSPREHKHAPGCAVGLPGGTRLCPVSGDARPTKRTALRVGRASPHDFHARGKWNNICSGTESCVAPGRLLAYHLSLLTCRLIIAEHAGRQSGRKQNQYRTPLILPAVTFPTDELPYLKLSVPHLLLQTSYSTLRTRHPMLKMRHMKLQLRQMKLHPRHMKLPSWHSKLHMRHSKLHLRRLKLHS